MKFFLAFLVLFSSVTHAANRDWNSAEQKAVLFGHNIGSTSYTLGKGSCSAGLQILACGVGEDTTVGMTPFLLLLYNMYGFYTRHALTGNANESSALQAAYFETDRNLTPNPSNKLLGYEMQAAWLSYIHSWHYSSSYAFHLTTTYGYYWNDTRPFSLRRDQGDDRRGDVTFSTLHQMELVNGFYILGELGVLGLNRTIPELITSASIGLRNKRFLFHMGYSVTSTFSSMFSSSRVDCNAQLFQTADFDPDACDYTQDFSVHPEVVVQFYF